MSASGKTTPRTPRDSRSLKSRVWDLFDEPSSSVYALVLSSVIMLAIALSTVCFIFESMPIYENMPVWHILEICFVSLFTLEYVCRFATCPMSKVKFMTEPFNLIDLISIMPFYAELIVVAITHGGTHAPDLRVLRTIRLFRIFRVLKMGKYATTLQVLANTLLGSAEALFMLFFCLFVALTFFGAAMFYVERGRWDEAKQCYVRYWVESSCSPFSSIPEACYWGVTTITTVGYGDVLPTTPSGRAIACATMICGILVIALPVTLIGQAFVHSFKESANTIAANKVLELSSEQMRIFGEKCHQSCAELDSSMANLMPTIKRQLIDAAVETGRFERAAAEEHINKNLGHVDLLMRKDFQRLNEYTNLLRNAHQGQHPHVGLPVQ